MSAARAAVLPLYPAIRETAEAYATVSDILEADDLPACDVRIPQWRKNGKSLLIRVRALDFEQQEQIQAEALILDGPRKGERDYKAFVLATWREGVIAPTFTADQAARLASKNPKAIEDVHVLIWQLSVLSQEAIDAYLAALADDIARARPPAELDNEPGARDE